MSSDQCQCGKPGCFIPSQTHHMSDTKTPTPRTKNHSFDRYDKTAYAHVRTVVTADDYESVQTELAAALAERDEALIQARRLSDEEDEEIARLKAERDAARADAAAMREALALTIEACDTNRDLEDDVALSDQVRRDVRLERLAFLAAKRCLASNPGAPLLAELATVTKERDNAKAFAEQLDGGPLLAELATLRDRNAKLLALVEELNPYISHGYDCQLQTVFENEPCSCAVESILARIAELKGEQP